MVYMDTEPLIARIISHSRHSQFDNFYTGSPCYTCDLTPSDNYPRVWADNKLWAAHRIIYAHYHTDFDYHDKSLDVRHRCHNSKCVRLDHLEVGSRSQNEEDKRNAGRNNLQRLTVDDVRDIRGWIELGLSDGDIADIYSLTSRAINHIRNRRRWADV